MQYERRDRIVELIRTELADVLRKVKDPRLSGFLTITAVEMSQDMKRAAVFYSIMGTDHEKENSGEALKSAAPYIRHEMKLRLRLKTIPTFEFKFDNTPERAGRILELLSQIEDEEKRWSPPASVSTEVSLSPATASEPAIPEPEAAAEPEEEAPAPKKKPAAKKKAPKKA